MVKACSHLKPTSIFQAYRFNAKLQNSTSVLFILILPVISLMLATTPALPWAKLNQKCEWRLQFWLSRHQFFPVVGANSSNSLVNFHIDLLQTKQEEN